MKIIFIAIWASISLFLVGCGLESNRTNKKRTKTSEQNVSSLEGFSSQESYQSSSLSGEFQKEKTSGVNTDGGYLKWPDSILPIEVKISHEFNDNEVYQIEEMGRRWEESLEGKTLFSFIPYMQLPNYQTMSQYNDEIIGVHKGANWFPTDYEEALAITQYFGRRVNKGRSNEYVELLHADIIINYKKFKFSVSTFPDTGHYDLATVVLHEFGHLLGLPHNQASSHSVMGVKINTTTIIHELSANDVQEIKKVYGLNDQSSNSYRDTSPREEQEEYIIGIMEIRP